MELNEEFRIDAEYYSPINLTKEDAVKRHKHEHLGDLCTLIAGPFGSTVTADKYDPDSGCRYIRGKDIQPLYLTKNDPVFVEKDLFDVLPQFHLKANDILLSVVGMKFGKTSLVYPEDCPAIFSCKSTLLRDTKISVHFLVSYLLCDVGYGLIRRGERGAAQPGINLFDIRNIPVPIFSNDFQTKVEALMKKSKELADQSGGFFAQAEKHLLSELGLLDLQPKHTLSFVKYLSDIEQEERMDAEYFQPKYDEIISAIKSCSSGWDSLGNLVTMKKCVEVGSGEYLDAGIPFVRVSNLSSFEVSEEKYISEELYAGLSQHQPKQGEILLSKDGSPGIACHLRDTPQKMIPSGGILRLKIKDNRVNEDYLTLVLNSLLTKEQVKRDCGGSIILHWRPDQVKETLIPILSKEKQLEIQQKVTESFSLRKQSKHLLECAKRAVEIAIEQDEESAMQWLEAQTREQSGYHEY